MPNSINKLDKSKKDMLECLEKCLGNVSEACKQSGISRTTHYNYIKDDEDYAQKVKELTEQQKDFVESKLFELIQGVTLGKETPEGFEVYKTPPCKTSIIFFLKTRAKDRGYIERQEIGHEIDNKKISIKVVDANTGE